MKALKHLEEIIGIAFLILFVGLAIVNVILRYFFSFILSWAEELILIAFVWSVYLGAITAYRTDHHVAIDFIVERMPKKVQKIIGYGVDILILVLSVYMTYLGIILCMRVGAKSTYVLKLSYVFIDLTVVVCFGAISIFGIYKLIMRFMGKYEYVDSITRTVNEFSDK